MASVFSVNAATCYVAAAGSDTHPYDSWVRAAHSIQDAVNAAGAAGTVYVTNGTYILTNQISITQGVTVRSWKNGALDRNGTLIDGNYPAINSRCFFINNAGAVVEGFTITNGCPWTNNVDGGGVKITAGTLRNCLVTGNRETNSHVEWFPSGGMGGGVFANGNNVVITNCDIIGNTARWGGGGMTLLVSAGKVWNCNIVTNTVTGGNGGGVYFFYSHGAEFCNSTVISNRCSASLYAGGVTLYGPNPMTMRNCLIRKNSAPGGPQQLCIVAANMTMENCTIEGNINKNWNNCTFTIRNTIATGNFQADTFSVTSFVTLASCRLAAMPATNSLLVVTTNNCITADPAFADQAGGDFRLLATSPCVNSGSYQAWMDYITDLGGFSRIDKFAGAVDMGCYELHPRGVMFKVR